MKAFDLGVGVAVLPGLVPYLHELGDLVTVLEVEPQTFWVETGEPEAPFRIMPDLEALRDAVGQPILAHGVSCPVGGAQPPDAFMVELFAESVRRLGARMASEHLAFNQVPGREGTFTSAFFLPPRQTPAGVVAAREAVARMQEALDVPFLVETPVNYLRPRRDEMSDGAFMAAVAGGADCGILLDLHNLWTNERNGRQRVLDYLAELPVERVREVHLAGGLERKGFWLDAHSGAIDEALLDIAARVLPELPNARALVFEVMPEFLPSLGVTGMREQVAALHRVLEGARRTGSRAPVRSGGSLPTAECPRTGPAEWERTLATLAINHPVEHGNPLAAELEDDPGLGLLRELVGAGRAGRVASSLPLTIRLILLALPRESVDDLLDRYAVATAPSQWGSGEGRRFAEWVRRQPLEIPHLEHVLAIDLAAMERMTSGTPRTVTLPIDPTALLGAIQDGRLPGALPTGTYELAVT